MTHRLNLRDLPAETHEAWALDEAMVATANRIERLAKVLPEIENTDEAKMVRQQMVAALKVATMLAEEMDKLPHTPAANNTKARFQHAVALVAKAQIDVADRVLAATKEV